MSEANYNLQNQKVSKLAIISLVIPCISIIGSFCFIFVLQHACFGYLISLLWLFFALPFLSLVCLIFGIWTLIERICNRGISKDYVFAILGILLSVLAFICAERALGCHRPEARLRICPNHMKEIHKAIASYSKTNNNQYVPVDKWCDILAIQPHFEKAIFLCPDYTDKHNWNREQPYICSYAINPNAEPNSAGDVVLLFETKDGWNQFGGSELMAFDNHYRKGCNVLFNDGHTEFIKPKRKDKLKWGTKIMHEKKNIE